MSFQAPDANEQPSSPSLCSRGCGFFASRCVWIPVQCCATGAAPCLHRCVLCTIELCCVLSCPGVRLSTSVFLRKLSCR